MNPLLYYRTIKYLKPRQVINRLQRKVKKPRIRQAGTPELNQNWENWHQLITVENPVKSRSSIEFLNCEGDITTPDFWNDPSHQKLWLYNLHYFDFLKCSAARKIGSPHSNLVDRWIAENPIGIGNGWEAYPLSLRIVNWIKWVKRTGRINAETLESLAGQVRYLEQSIEWHLMANHLIANGKALLFAGAFFQGEEADRWFRLGHNLLTREYREQVLDDGGHFELSPMYHSIILEDLLDLINLYKATPERFSQDHAKIDQEWRAKAGKMVSWLLCMSHPDGKISFFNDSAFKVAARPKDLIRYAEWLEVESVKPAPGVTHLKESGYIRIEQGDSVVILDAAEVGPSYQPGHAHADTLSFEWSFRNKRIVVNSGTSVYEIGGLRRWQRSTAAHSTLSIDDEDSSEVWAAFRVGRRARPVGLSIEHTECKKSGTNVECSHDGYTRLKYKPIHTRRLSVTEHALTIKDDVSSNCERARARFHLHPNTSISSVSRNAAMISGTDLENGIKVNATCGIGIGEGEYYPEFGKSLKNRRLDVIFDGKSCSIVFTWD